MRKKILLAVLGTILACLSAEGALRLAEARRRQDGPRPLCRSRFPEIGYERIPGYKHPAYPHSVNRLGMWDREYPPEKPRGGVRIFVAGDSLLVSENLRDDETFPKQLERLLGEQCPGRPVEVMNAGVSGYDARQGAGVILHRAVPLAPDLVVWAVCLNDFWESPDPMLDGPDGSVDLAPVWPTWRHKSALYRLVSASVATATGRAASEKGFRERYPGYDDPARWEEAFACYRRVLAVLRERGTRLLLVVFPLSAQLPSPDPQPQRAIRDLAKRAGIAALDLRVPLRDARDPAFGRNDLVHPNAAGHAVIARTVLAWIRTETPFLKDAKQ